MFEGVEACGADFEECSKDLKLVELMLRAVLKM